MAKKRKKEKALKTLFKKTIKWWKTDTAKAIATIIAIVLIPVSVLAWDYSTKKQNININESSNETSVQNSAGVKEDKNNNLSDKAKTENVEMDSDKILDYIDKLPDTSSSELYIVKPGDNIYKISISVCGNKSYYLRNMHRNYLTPGARLKVTCQ